MFSPEQHEKKVVPEGQAIPNSFFFFFLRQENVAHIDLKLNILPQPLEC
jgi:hypothetical protein